jgi:hypothetical protein
VDEWSDPTGVAFLGAMRAVFAATWCERMGRRWPDLSGDVDALCERTLAIGYALGRRETVDALRRGRSLEEVAADLGGRLPKGVERGPHEGPLDDPPPRRLEPLDRRSGLTHPPSDRFS